MRRNMVSQISAQPKCNFGGQTTLRDVRSGTSAEDSNAHTAHAYALAGSVPMLGTRASCAASGLLIISL